MLRVLCSETELQEDGEVIAIGDHVSRVGCRVENVFYGTDLDEIEWRFDQYADAVGYEAVTISGQVIAISAIYVRFTATSGGGWAPRLGSAHLEPLDSTASTRKIEDVVDWGPLSPPDEHGHAYRAGYPQIAEGDEHLSGWLFTLDSPHIELNAPPV